MFYFFSLKPANLPTACQPVGIIDMPKHRGLLEPRHFAERITGVPSEGKTRKTMLIRHVNCRVVQPGGCFSLVESGHASPHGQGKVTATLKFLRNRWIPHDKIAELEKSHHVSEEEYSKIRSKWKTERGGCVGWEVALEQVLDCPFFIPVAGDPDKAQFKLAGPPRTPHLSGGSYHGPSVGPMGLLSPYQPTTLSIRRWPFVIANSRKYLA
jgi:hypothetical protein